MTQKRNGSVSGKNRIRNRFVLSGLRENTAQRAVKETIATSKADGATKMFRSRMARKKREYISVSEFFTSSKLRSGPSEKNTVYMEARRLTVTGTPLPRRMDSSSAAKASTRASSAA